MDSHRPSRGLEFSANRPISWEDSDSPPNRRQEEDCSANQPSQPKPLERQMHSASQPSNQLWEDFQPSDKAIPRLHYLDSQRSLKHKEGCSDNSQHSESQQEQVFSERPPRKLASPLRSACNLRRRKRAHSTHSDNHLILLQPQRKTPSAYPNSPRPSLNNHFSPAMVDLVASKSSAALPDLTKELVKHSLKINFTATLTTSHSSLLR